MATDSANGHTNGAQKYELPFKLNDPDLLKEESYIDAKWVGAKSGKRFEILGKRDVHNSETVHAKDGDENGKTPVIFLGRDDPGSDTAWASCPDMATEDVDAAVESSHKAFQSYGKVNPRQRATWLLEWDRLIRANTEDLAKILTYETGKPLAEAKGELAYASGFTWWFAGEAERVQGNIAVPSAPNRRVFTIKQPIGVAVALVPWNFPIAMVLRKAGAAFAAGCTIVVKPSPETPLTCLTLAHLATKAGFPPGVFNVLTTSLENTPTLSEALCKHPLTKKVTFTGSTRVGKIVAKHCSEGLKKVTMELGGNCPYIIFDDANLDQALDQLMLLKWRHAGQACISANRIYVQSGVYDKFAEMFRKKTAELKIGHGAESATTLGPVTTPRSIDKVTSQIEDATKLGAKIINGGKKVEGKKGYFFEPTILTGMKPEMLISREESFAPVAALYKFDTEEQAVTWANDTSMGLASYAFTKNADRLWRMLENLEAGMIGMNTGNSSAAESPFGGIKESGYGKESGKDVAVAEYMITKTGTFTLEGQY